MKFSQLNNNDSILGKFGIDMQKSDSKKDKEQSYKYNPGSIQHSIQTVISKLLPAKQKGFQLPVGKWNKEGDKIDYMAQVAFDAAQPRPPFHKMKQMIADELGIEGSKVIVQSLGKEELESDKKLKEGEKAEQQWRAHIIITVPKQQMEQMSLRDHFDDNEEQAMKDKAKEKAMSKMKKSEDLILDIDLDAIEEEILKAEGSRGGKVIGHTKSGKPVYYRNGTHSSYKDFGSDDHKDAAEIHRKKASEYREKSKKNSSHSQQGMRDGDEADTHNQFAKEHDKKK